MITCKLAALVFPISVVVVSVKLQLAEVSQIDIILPARAFDPLRSVYSNHAPSYDEVDMLYIVAGVVPKDEVAVVYNEVAEGLPKLIS